MNIKLQLQYDGSAYNGWQIQPNGVTVQETVQNAIEKITGTRPRLTGCGRTDSGVHALGYVCNFFTDTKIPVSKIPYALNANMPEDIVCVCAEIVSDSFHSQKSALGKRYIYNILNTPFPDAFLRKYAWHYPYILDVDKMRLAARGFLGTHDFIGFASSGFTVKTTVRTINSLDVLRQDNKIVIDVSGNGFLYNMVRIIAGTLVYVGGGKISPDDIPGIILSKNRERAGITAPAQGLFLKEVYY